MKPRRKPKQQKIHLIFDEKDRTEYLTGFRKRNLQRKVKKKQTLDAMLKEEKKKIKKNQKEAFHNAIISQRQVPEIQHLLEPVTYDLPDHTVTVSQINNMDSLNASTTIDMDQGVPAVTAVAKTQDEVEKLRKLIKDMKAKRIKTLKKSKVQFEAKKIQKKKDKQKAKRSLADIENATKKFPSKTFSDVKTTPEFSEKDILRHPTTLSDNSVQSSSFSRKLLSIQADLSSTPTHVTKGLSLITKQIYRTKNHLKSPTSKPISDITLVSSTTEKTTTETTTETSTTEETTTETTTEETTTETSTTEETTTETTSKKDKTTMSSASKHPSKTKTSFTSSENENLNATKSWQKYLSKSTIQPMHSTRITIPSGKTKSSILIIRTKHGKLSTKFPNKKSATTTISPRNSVKHRTQSIDPTITTPSDNNTSVNISIDIDIDIKLLSSLTTPSSNGSDEYSNSNSSPAETSKSREKRYEKKRIVAGVILIVLVSLSAACAILLVIMPSKYDVRCRRHHNIPDQVALIPSRNRCRPRFYDASLYMGH
ncbi:nucleolar protein 12 [Caerostris darwini]|uniref:Nucleolar protein 12 n=1 Tax=Caerostris darwini TaxID=1538125 RepID=A0AAV4X697_9ARAC|nr:nucleolar protein 12 [Caerostris darwini]